MSEIEFIFSLLVFFQLKHFLCDFPLQRPYMLRKTSAGWDFILPLTVHAGMHSLITLMLVLFFNPALWWLVFYDFIIHFFMDRIKSGPRYLGRFNDVSKSSFWVAFGLDQMVHHLTHYSIIWFLYRSLYM